MTGEGITNESHERLLWEEFHGERRAAVREELAQLYEPFVHVIAARLYGARIDDSVSFADYLQYGRIGLLEAVDRYDSKREVAFSAFAASRIRGSILNGLVKESETAAQNRFWRAHVQERVESLRTAVAPRADRASLAQIATITVGLALGALIEESSEDFEPADPNPGRNPYAVNEVVQLSLAVKKLVLQLPERERFVIQGHYARREEFQKLAEQLSVSKGRVAQLHAQALRRLRDWLDNPKLDRKF